MVKRRIILIASASIIVVLAVIGVIASSLRTRSISPQSMYSADALAKLPRDDKSKIDISHLAANLIPPTNHWFTGAVLQADPKPIFPLPLSFRPSDTHFSYDIPKVVATSKLIQAADNLPVAITPHGARHYRVTRYDETSLDLTYYTADSRAIATVTVVAGLPYIYVVSHDDATFDVSTDSATPTRHGSTLTYASDSAAMSIAPFHGASTAGDNNKATITAPKDSYITLYAAKNTDDSAKLANNAAHRVTETDVSFRQEGEDYITSIAYATADNKPTWYARLPHQGGGGSGPKYDTIYGQVTLQEGDELEYKTPGVPLTPQLDVAKLSDPNKQLLIATLKQDTGQLQPYPADTYFGGKMLYRDAQLLTIAKQLGQTTIAAQLQARIHTELSVRFTPSPGSDRSFYYDSRAHGIVGVTPAFGSEMFNDHHFHYGYFIYAASVLAQYDKGFKDQYGEQINLLVADIANSVTDANFPTDRMYDPYFGHSWASGDSPFADGNNQESSSEAVNAWVGMGLWANQTGNSNMAARAGWMLSGETAATGAYWLNFDTNSFPYSSGYDKQIAVLNWGAKRDYATFFSSSPKAMLGIQLIPMSPTTASYLSQYKGKISAELKEARSDPSVSQQFDDYLLMYEALQGRSADLLDQAKSLPDTAIDGANSRSYLYAWLMSQ